MTRNEETCKFPHVTDDVPAEKIDEKGIMRVPGAKNVMISNALQGNRKTFSCFGECFCLFVILTALFLSSNAALFCTTVVCVGVWISNLLDKFAPWRRLCAVAAII